MRVSERTFNISDLIISEEQESVRTPGVHVSDVIRHMAKSIGIDKEGTMDEDDLENCAVLGRLWEELLSKSMFKRPRYERIGEIECDGIILSPDSVDTVDWSLQEMKAVWRSARRSLESEFKWLVQIKAYCYALGMCRASVYVIYICGVHKPPVPPIPRAWDILFSPSELEENWSMILTNAKELR